MAGLGIGILGAARITERALVDPAKSLSDVRLAAIAARDPKRAKAYAKRHRVAQVFDDYAGVIACEEVDLVYNPLPINLHAEWTIKALEAGKHVLCEKPFAMNVDEARAMVAAAEKSGKRLIEAFHYRYHPAFQACLNWLAAEKIGEVRELHATFNVAIKDDGSEIRHRVETGGGAMMDLGCYPLHWALTIMGEVPTQIWSNAHQTPSGVDEHMHARLRFDNGAEAYLNASMALDKKFEASLQLIGTKGRILFTNPLAPQLGARLLLEERSASVSEAKISPVPTYFYQLEAVIEAIANGTPLPTEGEIILRQQSVLDGIYAEAGLGHLRYLNKAG
jgi:predicted dehydrogenase